MSDVDPTPPRGHIRFVFGETCPMCRGKTTTPLACPNHKCRDGVHHRTFQVMQEVRFERTQQDRKFGEQNHDPLGWLAIIMEEVGEAAQVAAQIILGEPGGTDFTSDDFRTEMVQVAAVAVSVIEWFDRDRATAEVTP